MAWLKIAFLILVAAIVPAGCTHTPISGPSDPAGITEAKELNGSEKLAGNSAVLEVRGLSCPLCASNIDKQLLKVDGVTAVTVDIGKGEATLTLDGTSRTTRTALANAVRRSGFTLVAVRAAE